MHDWFQKLFIDEAKPALERHSSGGGLKYEMGTYVSEEDRRTSLTLEHNLGVVPTFVLFYTKEKEPFVGLTGYMCTYAGFSWHLTNESHFIVGVCNPGISGGYAATQSSCGTETTFRINTGPTYKMKAGVTYHWIVAAAAD